VDDDLIQSLTRFYQEVVMPDFREALQTESGNLRREVLSHFDDLYHRFDRLEIACLGSELVTLQHCSCG
jgi:hypothetical protein